MEYKTILVLRLQLNSEHDEKCSNNEHDDTPPQYNEEFLYVMANFPTK